MNLPKSTYTILLVDDDELTRSMYIEKFKDETAFAVIVAKDGAEALEVVRSQSVDLVFTGIEMPRMGGFQLIDEMRLDPRLTKIPVMVSSHLGRDQDRSIAKSLGVRYFIVRGETSPNQVIHLIRRILITEKAEYSLEISKNSEDYEVFSETFLGSGCAECSAKDHLPVRVILERRGNQDLFSIESDCNRCK